MLMHYALHYLTCTDNLVMDDAKFVSWGQPKAAISGPEIICLTAVVPRLPDGLNNKKPNQCSQKSSYFGTSNNFEKKLAIIENRRTTCAWIALPHQPSSAASEGAAAVEDVITQRWSPTHVSFWFNYYVRIRTIAPCTLLVLLFTENLAKVSFFKFVLTVENSYRPVVKFFQFYCAMSWAAWAISSDCYCGIHGTPVSRNF